MAKKPRKARAKKAKFEDWEIAFMKCGPPGAFEDLKEHPHRWAYLDGYDIWQRLKKEPGFNPDDYPFAVWAYRNKEKP